MVSQERPKKLVVIVMKKQSGNSKQINIKKKIVTLGEKQDFVFMGMSLVIMKEEKHRKHMICCESRFILMEYFSIFSMRHES